MAKLIKIRKGLDINLKGKAPEAFFDVGKSESYAIVPDHYVGITPKALVREGDRVKAGTPLMIDKGRPEIKFVSPVSGVVTGVNRGEKRKIISITVKPDGLTEYEQFDIKDVASYDAEGLKALLLTAGLWPSIKQRPYDRVANPSDTPRDIFVTAYNSAPLAPDFDFVVKGQEDALQTGLSALAKLTGGKVYFGVRQGSGLHTVRDVEVVELSGPHPVGNAGVMINHIKPVNKGEVVWTIHAADVLMMGRLLKEKKVDFTKVIALTGSEFRKCGYAKVIAGCTIRSIIAGNVAEGHVRLISGNVLTGTKVGPDDFLGAYDDQLTAIPEGDDVNEFVGWATPGFGKFSVSRTYFSWLSGRNREYVLDARIRGGRRAMIMSNEYDKVFPMDILPEYLLKAIIAFDIDKMENLGIYEVAPEDFALCEFVDTSKIEIQKIVRNGLDLLYKELN
ncbi:MAG: Na(+)-translocating NADH-quinone reductase subunit A [Tannerella sp.]|jgi:Na+-transporting NADH:ubiquinone oxidoreductase subunit A|nr:Na(+)-translocating NADH-quinone reductase subunit A [Tannerella sp.]